MQTFIARFQRTRQPVQVFIRALPVSQQGMAKIALRRHLGRAALDWDAIEVARYHRNEPALEASVLVEAQRDLVRKAAQGSKELAIVECLFTARRFEVAALCWQDVDLQHGRMTIQRGKGGKAAVTLLTVGAVTALMAWRDESGHPGAEKPVFPRPVGNGHVRPGGHYSPGGLGKLIQRLLIRAGVWNHNGAAHRFRRTFATEWLKANPDQLLPLQRVMRHARVDTTAKYVYSSVDQYQHQMGRVKL